MQFQTEISGQNVHMRNHISFPELNFCIDDKNKLTQPTKKHRMDF